MPERDDHELADQLRAYVDGVAAPVASSRARVVGQRRVARRRRGALAAIAAAAVAAVGGTLAVASTGGRSSGPAATTSPFVARTTTSIAAPDTSGTAAPLTTTSVVSPPVTVPQAATGRWDEIVTGPDGVFAVQRDASDRYHPLLARLDERGRIVAQTRTPQFDDLRVDTDGLLFTTFHGTNGYDLNQVIDARTLRVVLSGHVISGLFTGHGTTLWLGRGQRLAQLLIGSGPSLSGGVDLTVPGAPLADLAIDPSGQRLYVLQFDAHQTSLVSVRSAVDGHLLVAPTSVGGGPGPGHIVAASNGVWIAQPTGMMGFADLFDAATLQPIGQQLQGSNGITVKVARHVVLVDRAATDNAVLCLDPNTGAERGRVPGTAGELFATDGTRIYQAPFAGGIEVHTLPASCRTT